MNTSVGSIADNNNGSYCCIYTYNSVNTLTCNSRAKTSSTDFKTSGTLLSGASITSGSTSVSSGDTLVLSIPFSENDFPEVFSNLTTTNYTLWYYSYVNTSSP